MAAAPRYMLETLVGYIRAISAEWALLKNTCTLSAQLRLRNASSGIAECMTPLKQVPTES